VKIGALFAIFFLALLVGCRRQAADEADKAEAAPAVQVVPVARGTVERTLPVTGTLMAIPTQEATVSPPVAGGLDAVSVGLGQTVTKGQIVARLSTRQLTGQIEQAQATIQQGQIQVQQASANALQQQAQTRSAILQAVASVRNAEAGLAGAQATLTGDEATLRNAEQNLARAQALFADGLVAQKDVEAAQLAVRTARAQGDAQRQTIDGQRQTVAGQRQALAAARAAGLQDVVKRKDVQIARQQVRNAQGALKTAHRRGRDVHDRRPAGPDAADDGAAGHGAGGPADGHDLGPRGRAQPRRLEGRHDGAGAGRRRASS